VVTIDGCGGHLTWWCRECGQRTYGPPLGRHCTAVSEPAAVRISNLREPDTTVTTKEQRPRRMVRAPPIGHRRGSRALARNLVARPPAVTAAASSALEDGSHKPERPEGQRRKIRSR
jgi:hypothetical protein